MRVQYTDALLLSDLSTKIAASDSVTLTDDQKKPFISIAISAASKALVLGLKDGDMALVYNTGDTNAITVKNLATDTGTSLAYGKCAVVVASTTANATVVTALN